MRYLKAFMAGSLDWRSGLLAMRGRRPEVATYTRERRRPLLRVYFTGREGTTLVIKTGPTFEVLATNTLDDGFDASPALVDNQIFMRGYRYLYCIE